jgi:hypothetical protein
MLTPTEKEKMANISEGAIAVAESELVTQPDTAACPTLFRFSFNIM